MKKVISILLALTLCMSLCIPAFAAEAVTAAHVQAEYVLDTFCSGSIIKAILGYIPGGAIFSAIFNYQSVTTDAAARSIQDAGGYAKVTNISDPYSGERASVVSGWIDQGVVLIFDADGQPDFSMFPYHWPFP